VIFVDERSAAFGEEAKLSFESGVMLLNDVVVTMRSASQHAWKPDGNFLLEVPGTSKASRKPYLTSGYEIVKREQTDRLGTFDPILHYSQNSHLVCPRKLKSYSGSQFQGRAKKDIVLFLFPLFSRAGRLYQG
jgi:hypothetical protein